MKLFENIILNQIFKVSYTNLFMNTDILNYFLFTNNKPSINNYKKEMCDERMLDKNYTTVDKFVNSKTQFNTCYIFTYNHSYGMSISIKQRKTINGHIDYFFSGSSGDFYMHQRGMIRATKEINLKIIQMFFPEVKNNNLYRSFLNNEIRFDELISDYSTYKSLTTESNKIYEKYLMMKRQKEFNI